MTVQARHRRRFATVGALLAGGALLTGGAWIGGQHGLAIGLGVFYVVASVVAYLWSGGHSDIAAIMRVSGDERQRSIDVRASAIAGFAMAVCCIAGAAIDLARGGSGYPWTLVCGVGGATYAVAIGAIARRA